MSRTPKVDPRPFVTHKKKMFLEQMTELQGLYTVVIGGKVTEEILAVKRGKFYSFFKEVTVGFEPILEQASDYLEFKF
jgi:hypothetical protein